LVHQVITSYIAVSHQGSKAQKSRSDVSGSGLKPWKQKGSGRARAGSKRSPIFRKGGVTFASKAVSCRKKINKKMYYNVLCIILSELLRSGCLLLVDSFKVNSVKTKSFINKLQSLNVSKALIIVDSSEYTKTMYLASRNVKNFYVCVSSDLNPLNLIGFDKVLISVGAMHNIEEKML
jgi:large subunit ribosomal protein L4